MKKNRRNTILEHLESGMNVGQTCKKVGIARNTFYRWLKENYDFSLMVEDAQVTGNDEQNDITENKLMQKIIKGDGPSIRYKLDRCHPKYSKSKTIKSKKISKIEVEYKSFGSEDS